MQNHIIKINAIFLSENEKKLLKTFIRALNSEYQNIFACTDDPLRADFLLIDVDNPKGADQYKTYSAFGFGGFQQAVAYGKSENTYAFRKDFFLQKPLRSGDVEALLKHCLQQQFKRQPTKKLASAF